MDLITRLGSAPKGSRELEFDIAMAIDWHERGVSIRAFKKKHPDANVLHWSFPKWTRSLDAALTLVPEGRWWVVNSGVHAGASKALVDAGKAWEQHESNAATPPLALCAAALKAREIEK